MTAVPQPPRHWFIRLRLGAWASVVASQRGLPDDALLGGWGEHGHPLVARRRQAGDRPGHVAAALALPPACPTRRIAFDLAVEAIAGVEPPPSLVAVRAVAPQPWHATLDALAALGRAVSGDPLVFGSFAWQALTGLPYITAASDLDLLWPMTPALDVPTLLVGLARLEETAPGRLDGELVQGPTGAGVQWREWASGTDEVLVKGADAVALQPRALFLRGI